MRQWVLTVPHDVRRVLALRPDTLTVQNRLFVEEIARFQKQKAKVAACNAQRSAQGELRKVYGRLELISSIKY